MNNKAKAIAAGSVIALLLLVVVYLNFFSGSSTPANNPVAEKEIQAQIDHNKNNPIPEPDLSALPESSRKPGKVAPKP